MMKAIKVRVDLIPLRPLMIIGVLHGIFSLITLLLATVTGSPFVPWFRDTPALLLIVFGFLVVFGIVWDGMLLTFGLTAKMIWRLAGRTGAAPLSKEALRPKLFYTHGISPIILLLATAIALLGTSNITLINMELLSHSSRWRDQFLWDLEGGFLEYVAALPINTSAWDRLYHSCWGIELAAAFALSVIGRGPRLVLHYCVTMVVLFYVGRLFGVLNPVMGPAFFRPDLFGYLDGSITAETMQMVSKVMAMQPEQAMYAGGILLGGVSAMPSLHVAMVSVTAYWLARAAYWTIWVTIPWIILVWSSTVVLGWHYVSDGAGGIALGAACIWISVLLLRTFGMEHTRSQKLAGQLPQGVSASQFTLPLGCERVPGTGDMRAQAPQKMETARKGPLGAKHPSWY